MCPLYGGPTGPDVPCLQASHLVTPTPPALLPNASVRLLPLPRSTERYAYVAMAGQHQIWRLDTTTGQATAFSGSGYERNQNGSGPQTTAWAQPSGLALAPGGGALYVADSESSAVRQLDLQTGGGIALVGGDPSFSDNLFRFGDRDGGGAGALLQHPLAVLAAPSGKGEPDGGGAAVRSGAAAGVRRHCRRLCQNLLVWSAASALLPPHLPLFVHSPF